MKERRYTMRHYLLGALPARLGDEMSGQTLLLIGLFATQSAVLGSTVLAALTFSAAIGGPLLGATLDRSSHPGRVLAIVLGLYSAGIGVVAMSIGFTPVAFSIGLALGAGALMPAISGGWSSRLKSFMADEQMTKASALDAATFNIAGLAGPALAGLIAAAFGVYWAVVLLVVLLAAALPMAWLLPQRATRASELSSTFVADVVVGFKTIFNNAQLFKITLMSVISYSGIGILWVAYPLIGLELWGEVGYGGLLASVLSVAALIATIAYGRWPTKYTPDTIAFVSTLVLAAGAMIMLFAGSIFGALLAVLMLGLADGPQLAAIFAIRHREAPEWSRSQVFTTAASLKITAAAAGTAVAGQLSTVSLKLTLLAACFAQLLAAATFLLVKR
jgi:MFS family permease